MNNDIIVIKNRTHEAVDMNNDYTLPDYITDVRKLVRCDSKAILHNIYRNENMTTYEGEVIYSLLIICEDDSVRNIIYSEDFSINCSGNKGEVGVCDCTLENCSARLTSPRRINCRCKVVIKVKNNVTEDTSIKFKGDIKSDSEFSLESVKVPANALKYMKPR